MIEKFACKLVPKFFISNTTVTVNEGQGHPNWCQNLEFWGFYNRTMITQNCSENVCIQANIIVFVCLVGFLFYSINSPFKKNKQTKQNHIIEHWLNNTTWIYGLKDQNILKVYQILSRSIENFARQLAKNFCSPVSMWPWIKVTIT